MQQTLILLKPDAVQRRLVGDITHRFERKGLRLVGLKLLTVPRELAEKHYAVHKGKPFYESLLSFLTSGPAVAMVWEGREAVAVCRNLMGLTDGAKAPPGTIRGDFAHTSKGYTEAQHKVAANLIHASGNVEEAKYEVELWFSAEELHDYQTLAEKYTF